MPSARGHWLPLPQGQGSAETHRDTRPSLLCLSPRGAIHRARARPNRRCRRTEGTRPGRRDSSSRSPTESHSVFPGPELYDLVTLSEQSSDLAKAATPTRGQGRGSALHGGGRQKRHSSTTGPGLVTPLPSRAVHPTTEDGALQGQETLPDTGCASGVPAHSGKCYFEL